MVKQFFQVIRRYIRPYKANLVWSIILNFLSQWLNIFSFAALVPILQILFQVDRQEYVYQAIDWSNLDKDVLINDAYWYVSQLIADHGALWTLIAMGIVLIVMTAIKTASYFASSAVMIPFRTGITKDIRLELYNKVLRLPLSFFSEERKGDIVARMSADVQVVETALTSSVDMLIKSPIAMAGSWVR